MPPDEPSDPDRAAILARRRRFIALALSGMATGGCKHQPPQPCLSVPPNEAMDEDQSEPDAPGPFVEDPGAPVEGETDGSGTGQTGDAGETTEPPPESNPQPCLRLRVTPRPCLDVHKN